MKTLLTATCIISIACGYIIGKSISSSPKETQNASSTQTRYDRPNTRDTPTRNNGDNALLDSILGGHSITEIPAADLAALITKLSKIDPDMDTLSRAKQSYQLQLLLAKLSVSDLINVATELSSDPKNNNSEKISSVISALADKNHTLALDWISTQEDSSKYYAVILGSIAKNDPTTASSLLRSAMLDGTITGDQLWRASYSIAQSIAKLGADPLLTYLDSLPQQQQSNIVYNSISNVPENERIKLLDQIYQRNQDGRLKGVSMDHLFSKILSLDKAGATEWFSKLPDSDLKKSFRTKAANSLFAMGDKESASEWMKEALAAAPGQEKQIIRDTIRHSSYSSPESIAFFAKLLPEGADFTAADLENNVVNSIYSSTDGLTAFANIIRDPNEKALLITNSLNKIRQSSYRHNANDFEILSHKIASMGFTGENAKLVNAALQAVKNPDPATNN
jgi:hypothetical protein